MSTNCDWSVSAPFICSGCPSAYTANGFSFNSALAHTPTSGDALVLQETFYGVHLKIGTQHRGGGVVRELWPCTLATLFPTLTHGFWSVLADGWCIIQDQFKIDYHIKTANFDCT